MNAALGPLRLRTCCVCAWSLAAVLLIGCGRAGDSRAAPAVAPAAVVPGLTRASPDSIAAPAPSAAVADSSLPDSLRSLSGFEPPLMQLKLAGAECDAFSRYIVIERELHDEVGSDVIVRPVGPLAPIDTGALRGRCATDSLPGDFVVRNEWAEYFMGVRDHRLYLDSGTGPERGLVIYDIDSRRKLFANGGVEIAGFRDSVTMVLWLSGEDTVVRALCPQVPGGMIASADTLNALDLHTSHLTKIARWRCAARS